VAPAAVAAAPAGPVTRAQLALVTALGAAVGAWSFVLLRAQRAPEALAAICSADGGCASLWSAPFALSVERLTSVPVAGWGLVWGLAAAGLGLAALLRRGPAPADAIVTSLRFISAAGVLGVFVLLSVIASERTFCVPCAGAHALILGHAAIALFAWRRHGLARPGPGAVLAGGSLLWAYLAVAFTGATATGIPAATKPDATADATLADFIAKMPPPERQALADALGRMRRGPALTLPAPRALRGPATAPVRFTEFTDIRCSHCAHLHEVWGELERALPAGSFSVESRFYPLDGGCNPVIRSPARDPVRCLAPRVQICRERDPAAHELAGALFTDQRTLTPERVYELAAGDRAALDACVASPVTASKLESDVALAEQYSPDGTPLVLVNGRLGSALPQYLYAIVMARGSPDHPAFSVLPPANEAAHIH
jgi:protein-disulfide isomerase